MMHVSFHPEAEADAEGAGNYYAARSLRAAAAFALDLDRAISLIVENPRQWPEHVYGTRRILFARFPYSVVYRLAGEAVQVLAVAHGHREPGYWVHRQ